MCKWTLTAVVADRRQIIILFPPKKKLGADKQTSCDKQLAADKQLGAEKQQGADKQLGADKKLVITMCG